MNELFKNFQKSQEDVHEAYIGAHQVLDEFKNKVKGIEQSYRGFLDIGAEQKLSGI